MVIFLSIVFPLQVILKPTFWYFSESTDVMKRMEVDALLAVVPLEICALTVRIFASINFAYALPVSSV